MCFFICAGWEGRREMEGQKTQFGDLRNWKLMLKFRRRTHQSGPLGELFDHGVDALNTSLECLIFAASQNLGMGWKTVMVLFACAYTGSIYPAIEDNH